MCTLLARRLCKNNNFGIIVIPISSILCGMVDICKNYTLIDNCCAKSSLNILLTILLNSAQIHNSQQGLPHCTVNLTFPCILQSCSSFLVPLS